MSKQQFGEGFGEAEFSWKDGGTGPMKFNKIAHTSNHELLMVSLVAEQQHVKQLRAALVPVKGAAPKVTIEGADIKTNVIGREDWQAQYPGKLRPSVEGYSIWSHKIGYGLAHALIVTKTPGFMMVVTEGTLWLELCTTRFTTPILREWMPYIEKQLRACSRLADAHTFNCQCGVMTASTKKLDDIVIAGLTTGDIVIPRDCPVTAAA